ncbi:MAG: hypothetical protein R3Y52_04370, partial [Psittacicella sp.]
KNLRAYLVTLESSLEVEYLFPFIDILIQLSRRYDCLVANPPYMGTSTMNIKLKSYVTKYFKDYKNDLCTAFMKRAFSVLKFRGYNAQINIQSWMFLNSFKNARLDLLKNYSLINLNHLGARAFEQIGGEVAQFSGFVFKNYKLDNFISTFIKNDVAKDSSNKEIDFLNQDNYFYRDQNIFLNLFSECQLAYNMPERLIPLLQKENLGKDFKAWQGVITSDNNTFLRLWYEVDYLKLGFNMKNTQEALESKKKWFPLNKGGKARKWSGFLEYVIDYENDGYNLKNFAPKSKVLGNYNNYFKEYICWSRVSNVPEFKYFKYGNIAESAVTAIFDTYSKNKLLSFINSNIANYISKLLNPTVNFQAVDFYSLPKLFRTDSEIESDINKLIELTDKFEIYNEMNIEFQENILIGFDGSLESRFDKAFKVIDENIRAIRDLEVKNNQALLDQYDLNGLQEFNSEVNLKDITVFYNFYKENEDVEEFRLKFNQELMKDFISYLVGIYFGRYSLSSKGIYCASNYEVNHNPDLNFRYDNTLSLVYNSRYEGEPHIDKLKTILTEILGSDNLDPSLQYIEYILGKSLENYLLVDFYKDHFKKYSKKPIYWQFESNPKNPAFKALVYIHRYTTQSLATLRANYLTPLVINSNIKAESASREINELKETNPKSSRIKTLE